MKRLISFVTLKDLCPDKVTGWSIKELNNECGRFEFYDHVKCKAKNCPRWKKLTKWEQE